MSSRLIKSNATLGIRSFIITEGSSWLHDLGGFVNGASSYWLCHTCQSRQARGQRESDSKSLMKWPKEARPEGGGLDRTNAAWLTDMDRLCRGLFTHKRQKYQGDLIWARVGGWPEPAESGAHCAQSWLCNKTPQLEAGLCPWWKGQLGTLQSPIPITQRHVTVSHLQFHCSMENWTSWWIHTE